jgi:hypothetical protein
MTTCRERLDGAPPGIRINSTSPGRTSLALAAEVELLPHEEKPEGAAITVY